jgi:hypothetical protein
VIIVGSIQRWLSNILPSVIFYSELIYIGCNIDCWISDCQVSGYDGDCHVTGVSGFDDRINPNYSIGCINEARGDLNLTTRSLKAI